MDFQRGLIYCVCGFLIISSISVLLLSPELLVVCSFFLVVFSGRVLINFSNIMDQYPIEFSIVV